MRQQTHTHDSHKLATTLRVHANGRSFGPFLHEWYIPVQRSAPSEQKLEVQGSPTIPGSHARQKRGTGLYNSRGPVVTCSGKFWHTSPPMLSIHLVKLAVFLSNESAYLNGPFTRGKVVPEAHSCVKDIHVVCELVDVLCDVANVAT